MTNFSPLLLTGDLGFVGQHALAVWPDATGLSSIAPNVDIRDKPTLLAALSSHSPFNTVLHLAGISFVPESFRAPKNTFEVNFIGTLQLLEALAESGFTGRFLFVSSGDAYGQVPVDELPVLETRALRPRNPYAVSKAAAEALCFQWSQTGPFEVMIARPFNHIGPCQAPTFAISDFARQIAEIKLGHRPPVLTVGNIDVTRDFSGVRDVLSAYRMILTHGQNGEVYNVCSGTERSVRSLVERLLALTRVDAEIRNDPVRYRPAEQARVFGSHEKLTMHTGWLPVKPIDETLMDLYHYWENEIVK